VIENTSEGEDMAQVIPFPLDRVTPPEDAPEVVSEPVDQESAEPVSVDDLRARIQDIQEAVVEPASIIATPTKQEKRAKNIALHQLGITGRSEAEVRDRLAARDIEPDVIEQEVGRLREVGLIDDHALATDLVESLRGRKKLGDQAISQALRRRKIPQGIITQALDDSEFDSDVAIFELARDRARSLGHLEWDVAFRRLVGFIQRRGYGGQQVFEAARRALETVSGDLEATGDSPVD
jgi:regulatory protein